MDYNCHDELMMMALHEKGHNRAKYHQCLQLIAQLEMVAEEVEGGPVVIRGSRWNRGEKEAHSDLQF